MENSEELYRPRYHFRPKDNWMNDPNGPIWYNGEFHLFYQYNPNGDTWGTIHWGHAKSKDLVHWEECQIALYPEQESGEIHCYSGCVFLKDDIPVIYYTSVGEGNRGPEDGALQRCAYSQDGMKTWTRNKDVILDQTVHEKDDEKINIAMWRDPFVFQEEDGYYMLLGGTRTSRKTNTLEDLKKQPGVIALYDSKDAKEWNFKRILIESKEFWLLECPNMISYGKEYLLLYSPMESVRYHIGYFENTTGKFITTNQGIFDHSILKKGFYAPNTYLNIPDGRKIVVGWIGDADRAEEIDAKGWSGMLSIPREVWISEGRLHIRPIMETKCLRKTKKYRQDEDGNIGSILARGRALEISLELVAKESNGVFELHFLKSNNQREFTALRYEQKSGILEFIRDHASLATGCGTERIELGVEQSHSLTLDIFVDYSVVEVYVNDSTTITTRVYPTLADSDGVVINECNNMEIMNFTIWELQL